MKKSVLSKLFSGLVALSLTLCCFVFPTSATIPNIPAGKQMIASFDNLETGLDLLLPDPPYIDTIQSEATDAFFKAVVTAGAGAYKKAATVNVIDANADDTFLIKPCFRVDKLGPVPFPTFEKMEEIMFWIDLSQSGATDVGIGFELYGYDTSWTGQHYFTASEDLPVYIQESSAFVAKTFNAENLLLLPDNYKGYVRIPRASFTNPDSKQMDTTQYISYFRVTLTGNFAAKPTTETPAPIHFDEISIHGATLPVTVIATPPSPVPAPPAGQVVFATFDDIPNGTDLKTADGPLMDPSGGDSLFSATVTSNTGFYKKAGTINMTGAAADKTFLISPAFRIDKLGTVAYPILDKMDEFALWIDTSQSGASQVELGFDLNGYEDDWTAKRSFTSAEGQYMYIQDGDNYSAVHFVAGGVAMLPDNYKGLVRIPREAFVNTDGEEMDAHQYLATLTVNISGIYSDVPTTENPLPIYIDELSMFGSELPEKTPYPEAIPSDYDSAVVFSFDNVDSNTYIGSPDDKGPTGQRPSRPNTAWNPTGAGWALPNFGSINDVYKLRAKTEAGVNGKGGYWEWIGRNTKLAETDEVFKSSSGGLLLHTNLEDPEISDWTGAEELMFYVDISNMAKNSGLGIILNVTEQLYEDGVPQVDGSGLAVQDQWSPTQQYNTALLEDGEGGWKYAKDINEYMGFFTIPEGYKGWVRYPISTWKSNLGTDAMSGKFVSAITLYLSTTFDDAVDVSAANPQVMYIDDFTIVGKELYTLANPIPDIEFDLEEALLVDTSTLNVQIDFANFTITLPNNHTTIDQLLEALYFEDAITLKFYNENNEITDYSTIITNGMTVKVFDMKGQIGSFTFKVDPTLEDIETPNEKNDQLPDTGDQYNGWIVMPIIISMGSLLILGQSKRRLKSK